MRACALPLILDRPHPVSFKLQPDNFRKTQRNFQPIRILNDLLKLRVPLWPASASENIGIAIDCLRRKCLLWLGGGRRRFLLPQHSYYCWILWLTLWLFHRLRLPRSTELEGSH